MTTNSNVKSRSGSFNVPDKNAKNRKTNSTVNKKVTSGSGGKSASTIAEAFEDLAASIDHLYIEKKCTVEGNRYVFTNVSSPKLFISNKNSNCITEIDGSTDFKNLLRQFLYKNHKLPLSKKNEEYLREMLMGKTLATGSPVVLIKRSLRLGESIYYNQASPTGEIVKIDKAGVSLVQHPLIKPISDKSLAQNSTYDLSVSPKELLNLFKRIFHFSRNDLILLTVYIVSLFADVKDARVLIALTGAPGNGKSTCGEDILSVHNPLTTGTPLLTMPKKVSDTCLILSKNNTIVFDNISPISEELSNILAIAISGGKSSSRELYTSNSLITLDISSNVILTAVTEVISKADLLSRTLSLVPNKPGKGKREEITDHRRKVESLKPKILGGIFNCLVQYLTVEGTKQITVPDEVRLGGFYKFAITVSEILGISEEEMSEAFISNQLNSYKAAASDDFLIKEIKKIVLSESGKIALSASDLRDRLNKKFAFGPNSKAIPGTGSSMSRFVFENVHVFESVGIEVERVWDKGKRAISFKYTPNQSDLDESADYNDSDDKLEDFDEKYLEEKSLSELENTVSDTESVEESYTDNETAEEIFDIELDEPDIDDSELIDYDEFEEDGSEEFNPYEEDEYFEDEPDEDEEAYSGIEYKEEEYHHYIDTLGEIQSEFNAYQKHRHLY